MNKNVNELASLIAKNNAGEQDAISDYFKLIAIPGFPQKFYQDIHEIISDEMNHSEKLSYWTTHLTGVHPAKD